MVNKNSSTSKIILTHPYHLVDPSPWPFFMAIECLVFMICILYFNRFK
jgi:hypothetical protein